jgi:hypothetical protein
MGCKTVLKRLWKLLPVSVENQRKMALDESIKKDIASDMFTASEEDTVDIGLTMGDVMDEAGEKAEKERAEKEKNDKEAEAKNQNGGSPATTKTESPPDEITPGMDGTAGGNKASIPADEKRDAFKTRINVEEGVIEDNKEDELEIF